MQYNSQYSDQDHSGHSEKYQSMLYSADSYFCFLCFFHESILGSDYWLKIFQFFVEMTILANVNKELRWSISCHGYPTMT